MELINVTNPVTGYYSEIPPRRTVEYWCMPEVIGTNFTSTFTTEGESRSREQIVSCYGTDAENHGFQ